MNLLQSIDETRYGPVLVTLNPPHVPDPSKTIGTWAYDHPLFTADAVAAQDQLPSISGPKSATARGGIAFAGAWTKYGFHEVCDVAPWTRLTAQDGFSSGLRAAAAAPLFAKPPFDIRPAERGQTITGRDRANRALVKSADYVRRTVEPLFDAWLLFAASCLELLVIVASALPGLKPVSQGSRQLADSWLSSATSRERKRVE